MSEIAEDYAYVLYIDEAGDDGLKRVAPLDHGGSSEWLCIGGFLVRAENEPLVPSWVDNIRSDIDATQSDVLHYRRLSPTKRRRACELLAKLPCQIFVVCSNKKNMRGHTNERAAKMGGTQWFYNYCVRLLMERVTEFCLYDSREKYRRARPVKVIFSERGNHSYGQTKAYWEWLRAQSIAGTTHLDKRVIRHEVVRFGLVDYVSHKVEAGLQLADVVASAFFQATDTASQKWAIEPAKALRRRVAEEAKSTADFGVVLQPTPAWRADLNPRQELIFRFYGYRF